MQKIKKYVLISLITLLSALLITPIFAQDTPAEIISKLSNLSVEEIMTQRSNHYSYRDIATKAGVLDAFILEMQQLTASTVTSNEVNTPIYECPYHNANCVDPSLCINSHNPQHQPRSNHGGGHHRNSKSHHNR